MPAAAFIADRKAVSSLAAASACIVSAQRCCDGGVPESLLRHLRMHNSRQQSRRVAVLKIVEAHAGNVLHAAFDLGKLVGKATGRHRLAILPTAGQRLAGQPYPPKRQQFLGSSGEPLCHRAASRWTGQ
jgi:hypothetical protein